MHTKDYAIFIPSYQRPNQQIALKYLLDSGYKGKWYIVVDTTDTTIDEYKKLYGEEHILIFSKEELLKVTDTLHYPAILKFVVYARNAMEQFAEQMGLKAFMVFDDDTMGLTLRYKDGNSLRGKAITKNIGELLEHILDYIIEADIACASPGYQNIYWGGINFSEAKDLLRLPVNVFFRNCKYKITWVSTNGEDVMTGIKYGNRGQAWVMLPLIQLHQPPYAACTNEGGHTDTYRRFSPLGMKLFFKPMAPNCYTISLLKDKWCCGLKKDHAIPKIVGE